MNGRNLLWIWNEEELWKNERNLLLHSGDHKNFDGKPRSDPGEKVKTTLTSSHQGNRLPERRDFFCSRRDFVYFPASLLESAFFLCKEKRPK
jgi:hypothetical protein